jgi:DNA-binding CsgD family transcriptional regulator
VSLPLTLAADPLTPRELDVLRLAAGWRSTAEIAAELYVSINTVKSHLKAIYRKLGTTHRAETVRAAVRLGLTGPPVTIRVMSLPTGLALSVDGVISGTPSTAGTYPFSARVTDTAGSSATAQFQIVVAPPLVISITGIPGAVAGQPYTFTLTAAGGQGPYTWTQV